jgi:hypothetical protein
MSWEKFARINRLTFSPEQVFKDRPRVVGNYRGYYLQLSPYSFGVEIALSAVEELHHKTPPGQPEINNLLTDPHLTAKIGGYFRSASNGQKFYYHSISSANDLTNDTKYIQRLLNSLCDLANNYRRLLVLGGEIISALETRIVELNSLSNLTLHLLRDIEHDTTSQLGQKAANLLCSRCLVRCQAHKVNLPPLLEPSGPTYYGCRICRQSREFLETGDKVIAVLDSQAAKEVTRQNDHLYINWLTQRKLFDFDKVEIVEASDEDVERLVVQIGNDTDPIRLNSYKKMACQVSPTCRLSQNTMRILKRTFSQVAVSKTGP